MKVLIVEDDNDKVRAIVTVLAAAGLDETADIDVVPTAHHAVTAMRDRLYGLMVLDLVLPMRLSEAPDLDGGTRLLTEIARRTDLHRPEHIVGLTVSEEARLRADPAFSRGLWTICRYGPDTTEWKEQLAEKARYLLARNAAAKEDHKHTCDVLFICALRRPELSQLKIASDVNWSDVSIVGDPTLYSRCEWPRGAAAPMSVVACSAPAMGMSASATLTTKACLHFRPKMVVMTGICAGRKGEVQLGDFVIGSTTWDYGSGKFKGSDDIVEFAASPYQIPLDPLLQSIAEQVIEDKPFMISLDEAFSGTKPSTRISGRLAPFASGAAVQAHSTFFDDLAKQQRKVAAVDMEAFAVCWAAREVLEPRPAAFVVKGVADFADEHKSDNIQDYCAFVSAKVGLEMARRYIDRVQSW